MQFLIYAFLLALAALFLVIDGLIALGLAFALARALPLAARGTLTTGHIAKIESRRPGRKAGVQVVYETAGGTFTTGGTAWSPRMGAPQAVRYDPAHPARATTMVRPWRTAATGIPGTLLVAALSAGMITGSVWWFAGVHRQLQIPLAGGSFAAVLTLGMVIYASGQYSELLRWRRMTQTTGKVKRFDEHAPGGPGILISFESADGWEDFWARAGSVLAGVGDPVTVYYDPAAPPRTATVETAADVRFHAIGGTVMVLFFGILSVMAISLL